MRITIERSNLLKSLNHVHRVVERRNTIPILSNVLLRGEGQSLEMKATDLDLEITESSFISGADNLVDTLQRLKAIGVGLALDDFGSGYSSLGYLARFPLDKIKVDQMFIRNLTESAASQAIVSSVQALSTGLGKTMLCEGIETEAQASYLQQLGCAQGQGYLFGKPQPAASIDALCREGPALRYAAS